MRATQLFFKTYRDLPDEFDSASHRLLIKTGMIQQVAAGIFNFLPLGWRSIQKIRQIINSEMVAIGAQEVSMPVVQPSELWELSGRIQTFIPPVARFQDRRERLMVLAPTHEETMSFMARAVIKSYRDLPKRLYQIQTKFRDEIRSRGGLLRTREFEMKDAYSFDADAAGMDASFTAMGLAYEKIFARCNTKTIRVDADSGGIGGKESSEFVMLANDGEDVVLCCENDKCSYAANREKAVFQRQKPPQEELLEITEFATPNIQTIEKLAEFVGTDASRTAKAVFYSTAKEIILTVIRGDYDINETKLKNVLGVTDLKMADADAVKAAKLEPGYVSPVGIDDRIKVVIDESVAYSPNLIGGANKKGYHLHNVNYPRDFKADIVADIAQTKAGSNCVLCGNVLIEQRGIEVGHIFKLGAVYSETMDVNFQDANAKVRPILMGCYGIGLGRLLAAVVEANHDENGIIFPLSVAPFAVYLVGLNLNDPPIAEAAEKVYAELTANGLDVLYDDRPSTAGIKFADADLLGFPLRLLVSKRGLENGTIELKVRRTGEVLSAPIAEIAEVTKKILADK